MFNEHFITQCDIDTYNAVHKVHKCKKVYQVR